MSESVEESNATRVKDIIRDVSDEDALDEIVKAVQARRAALRKASGRAKQSRGNAVRALSERLVPRARATRSAPAVRPEPDPIVEDPVSVSASLGAPAEEGSTTSSVVTEPDGVVSVAQQAVDVVTDAPTPPREVARRPVLEGYSTWGQDGATQAWGTMVAGWAAEFTVMSARLGGFCATVAQGDFRSAVLDPDQLVGQYRVLTALRSITADVFVLRSLLEGTTEAAVLERLKSDPAASDALVRDALIALDPRIAVGPQALLLVRRRLIMLLRDRHLYVLLVHTIQSRGIRAAEQRILMGAYAKAVELEVEMPELPDLVRLSLTDPDAYYGFEAVVGHSAGPPVTLDIRWEEPHGVERDVPLTESLLAMYDVQAYLRDHGLIPLNRLGCVVNASGA